MKITGREEGTAGFSSSLSYSFLLGKPDGVIGQCARYNQMKYLQEQIDRALADWKLKSQIAENVSNNWKKNEKD
jgi:hypothetical protein